MVIQGRTERKRSGLKERIETNMEMHSVGGEQSMKMERVSTRKAAGELCMDVVSLQHLMRQQRLPIGIAVKKEGKSRWTYYIYRNLLEQYKETGGQIHGNEEV